MKCGGGDPHAARLLAKWIDGLACQEVTIRTDKAPSICELARRARELCAEEATTVDEVSSPGEFGANGVAERVILTIGGLVKTTQAAVRENVLAGGPRLVGWLVRHAAKLLNACSVGTDVLTPFQRLK